MIIIKNNILPFKGYKAINICGIIFCRKELSDADKRHEYIHTLQMKEMLYAFFYIWYIIEYLIRLFKCSPHQAYRHILFEQEAYKGQSDIYYIEKRKHYAWLCKMK